MIAQDIIASNNKELSNRLIPSKDLPVYEIYSVDPRAEIFNQPLEIMDTIVITKTNGKWLVNGKPYYNINDKEKRFFDEFILAMKWEKQIEEHDNRLKKQ